MIEQRKWGHNHNVGTDTIRCFEKYADVYTATADEFISSAILKDATERRKTDINILIVGAGPNPSVSGFIESQRCKTMVLLEPNPCFHAKWKANNYFEFQNPNDIEIIPVEGLFENIDDLLSIEHAHLRFDYILCAHVFYYFQLSQIGETMQRIDKYLTNGGKAMIGLASDKDDDFSKMAKWMTDGKYALEQAVAKQLKDLDFSFDELLETSERWMGFEAMVSHLSLHAKDCVFNRNYFTDEAMRNMHDIDAVIHSLVSEFVEKQMTCDALKNQVLFRENSVHFVVQKKDT